MEKTFKPSQDFSKNAHIKSMDEYNDLYKKSIDDPIKFWEDQASKIDWIKNHGRM